VFLHFVFDGVADGPLGVGLEVIAAAARLAPARGLRQRVVSIDGTPVRSGSGRVIDVDGPLSLRALRRGDVLVLPGLSAAATEAELARVLERDDVRRGAALVAQAAGRGVVVAASCSSTFVLAASGALDGKEATTTWWLAAAFAVRFPEVSLSANQIVVDAGRVITAGSAFAHADLMLAILARTTSPALAHLVARYLVLDERPSQARYMVMEHLRSSDPMIRKLESFVTSNLRRQVTMQEMARAAATSPRTLARKVERASARRRSSSPAGCASVARCTCSRRRSSPSTRSPRPSAMRTPPRFAASIAARRANHHGRPGVDRRAALGGPMLRLVGPPGRGSRARIARYRGKLREPCADGGEQRLVHHVAVAVELGAREHVRATIDEPHAHRSQHLRELRVRMCGSAGRGADQEDRLVDRFDRRHEPVEGVLQGTRHPVRVLGRRDHQRVAPPDRGAQLCNRSRQWRDVEVRTEVRERRQLVVGLDHDSGRREPRGGAYERRVRRSRAQAAGDRENVHTRSGVERPKHYAVGCVRSTIRGGYTAVPVST